MSHPQASPKIAILDLSASGNYGIFFRDLAHFKFFLRLIVKKNFSLFQLDDKGRARIIKKIPASLL